MSECDFGEYNYVVDNIMDVYKLPQPHTNPLTYLTILGLMKMLAQDRSEETTLIIQRCLLLCIPLVREDHSFFE